MLRASRKVPALLRAFRGKQMEIKNFLDFKSQAFLIIK